MPRFTPVALRFCTRRAFPLLLSLAIGTPLCRCEDPGAPRSALPDETQFLALDDFQGRLGLNWQPVRHDPSHVSLTTRPGALTITTQRGTIHRNEKERGDEPVRNIFLIDNPLAADADFVLTTCITGFVPLEMFQQAGLVCYNDDDNYLKWVYTFNYPKGLGETFSFLTESGAESWIEHSESPFGGQQIWLRLTKRGNEWEYAASDDGIKYKIFGEGTWKNGAPQHVGLIAKNGGRAGVPEVDVSFEYFELRSPAPPRKLRPEE